MMYRLLSLTALLLAVYCALAMPDHPASMRMSGEVSHEVEPHNDTVANATTTTTSSEDDDDDNADDDAHGEDDDDDDEFHVEAKSSSCPAKQPEIAEAEKRCLAEYRELKKRLGCLTNSTPTKEIFVIQKDAPDSATVRLETVPDTGSSEETTDSSGHKHARMSYYYHCVLKKIGLLNEIEVPCKSKIDAWVAMNITDATQREQTKERMNHCLSELKDEINAFDNSPESTEETEQSTESSSKKPDVMNCDISKMLVCCLHHVECPLINYP